MSQAEENASAAEGPVIDHEPQPDAAQASQRRKLPKRAVAAAGVIAAALAIAVAGAWIYAASGLQIFGGGLADRLAALETRLSQLEQRAGEQAAQAQALADRLDGLGTALEARAGDGGRIAALESKQAALAKSLEALQARPAAEASASAPAPEAITQLQAEIDSLKAQLAVSQPPSVSLAPEREALAGELAQIAEGLKPAPAAAPQPDGTWSGWAMAQLSRYYTLRPAGSALAEDFARLAKAQDIAGAVRLIRAQEPVPPVLADWLSRAEAFLAKAGTP